MTIANNQPTPHRFEWKGSQIVRLHISYFRNAINFIFSHRSLAFRYEFHRKNARKTFAHFFTKSTFVCKCFPYVFNENQIGCSCFLFHVKRTENICTLLNQIDICVRMFSLRLKGKHFADFGEEVCKCFPYVFPFFHAFNYFSCFFIFFFIFCFFVFLKKKYLLKQGSTLQLFSFFF